jgi:hypothetical protein
MENRERLIELLTAVRYTTNDIEKVADEICLLFNVVGRSEQLRAFKEFLQSEYHLPVSNRMIDEFKQKQSS